MTDRDWLYVETLMQWTVYGLMDPSMDNHIFYVGVTRHDPADRVRQHCANKDSAAWQVIKDIEQLGEQVRFCIFAQNCSENAALFLESALATILPQIVNRTHTRDAAAFWKPYPNIRFL